MSTITNNYLSIDDIQQMFDWGLRIYPCIIERNEAGTKLPPQFPTKSGELTDKWKNGWLLEPQMPAVDLHNYMMNGYTLAGVIPDTMAVFDGDDTDAYFAVADYLKANGVNIVAEQSLSFNPENMKHHFYVQVDKIVSPSKKKLKDIGFPGDGHLLGAGHLIYINPKGWEISPAELGDLPLLQNNFTLCPANNTQAGQSSKVALGNLLIKSGERNDTLFSLGCSLRDKGLSEETIFGTLKVVRDNHCQQDPKKPLLDSELRTLANSASKYQPTGVIPKKILIEPTSYLEKINEFHQSSLSSLLEQHKRIYDKPALITGIPKLDRTLRIKPCDLNIIQAMSSHGKTTLMLNLSYELIKNNDNVCCYFITYEMEQLRLFEKFINMVALKHNFSKVIDYDYSLQQNTYKTDPALDVMVNQLLKDKKFAILNLVDYENLKALITEIKQSTPDKTHIFFLDYAQIIPNSFDSQGWQMIKDLAYGLERIAVENEVILFVGSQVNDKGETREGKDIYNAATNVLELFNHSHANIKDHPSFKGRYIDQINDKDVVTLKIAKSKEHATKCFDQYLLMDGYTLVENNAPVKTLKRSRSVSENDNIEIPF